MLFVLSNDITMEVQVVDNEKIHTTLHVHTYDLMHIPF